uniref:Uncharacterized protein n=1 Tax=Bombyx mori TaxID=7091 RepID=A0A8R2RBU1_BOMMO|nr:uncharacterized protein LOC119631231 [Bombyx mori]
MYRATTPREVTVVDGVLLIIDSPPARDHRNADGSAHMWRSSSSCFRGAHLFSKRSSRGAVPGVPYIRTFDIFAIGSGVHSGKRNTQAAGRGIKVTIWTMTMDTHCDPDHSHYDEKARPLTSCSLRHTKSDLKKSFTNEHYPVQFSMQ